VIGPVAPIVPSQRTARLCAAILDRRDTVPAPPFSTAVNNLGNSTTERKWCDWCDWCDWPKQHAFIAGIPPS